MCDFFQAVDGFHDDVIPVDPHLYAAQTISAKASLSSIHAMIDHIAPTHYQKQVRGVRPSLTMVDGYSDWSSDYGWYNDDSYEGCSSDAASDGKPDSTLQPETSTIGSKISGVDSAGVSHDIKVTYNYVATDGKTGDQPITHALAVDVTKIVGAARGVTSVDVSCTTNGHAFEGNPYDHLQGRAVDIDFINGMRVSNIGANTTLSLTLEAQALADPNIRYVEGPGRDWARSTPGGQRSRAPDLPTMNNHVHFATFNH